MAAMLALPPVKESGASSNRYLQKFTRHQPSPSHSSPSPSSHPHTLTLNERIVVSRQDGTSWAIAMGMVTMITTNEVELSLDKYEIHVLGAILQKYIDGGYPLLPSIAQLAKILL